MAELTKPQYSNPKSYPSDRKVYPITSAKTDFARPSEVPDQMFAVANVFKALGEGIDNYQTLYKQSEDTANQLQARDLINQKIKHTANLKELLALHLPNTKYQDLKLGDVIRKVRTMDLEGRSDLNIGATNEHNISIMQLPENLSPEVKAMVEETFIRQDVDFMSSLMGQVEDVQSQQTALIMSKKESEFKAGIYQDFHTATNRFDGVEAANKRRKTLNAEIDALAKTNSWSALEIEDKKRSAGQLMLQQDFNSSFYREGTADRTEKELRNDVLEMAKRGDFNYVDESGATVKLNPDFYSARQFTDQEQNRQLRINTKENDIIESQKLELVKRIRKITKKGIINLDEVKGNTFRELTQDGQFSKLSQSEIFKILHSEELNILKEGASKAENLAINELQEELSILRSRLSTDKKFETNIRKYADKVYVEEQKRKGPQQYKTKTWTGEYKPKSKEFLKTHYGEKFEQRHIREIITAYESGKAKNQEMFNITMGDSQVKQFIADQEQRIGSGATGVATFLQDIATGTVSANGEVKYFLDEDKLKPGTPMGTRLRNAGIDISARFPDASPQDVIATKKHILQKLINDASKESKRIHDALLKKQIGEKVTPTELTARLDRIAGDYHTSLESMKQQGNDAFEDRVGPWKGKAPTEAQLNTILAFRGVLDRITDHAQDQNKYDINELERHKNELRKEKVNGVSIDKDYSSSISTYAQRVATELENRQRALLTDGRNIGFTETKQDEILQRDGKYDMYKFFEWADKKGLNTNSIEIISSAEKELITGLHNSPNLKEAYGKFLSLLPTLNQYGNIGSRGYDTALQNIMDNLPRPYRHDFKFLIKGVPIDIEQIKIAYMADKEDI